MATITRKFYTYSGAPIDDGIVVKAQLWYKNVANNPLVGATTATDGERTFTVTESGLYYFYLGVGDDDLMYDPECDEVFEVEAYGTDDDDGIYLCKDVPLPTATNVYLFASTLEAYLVNNRTAFGNNMSAYTVLIMIREAGDDYDTHNITVNITDAVVSINVEPAVTYPSGDDFHVDLAFIRE